MPLPLTVSCFSKIQIDFTFLVPAHLGSPGKGPLNGCVCVNAVISAQAQWLNRRQQPQGKRTYVQHDKMTTASLWTTNITSNWHKGAVAAKLYMLSYALTDTQLVYGLGLHRITYRVPAETQPYLDAGFEHISVVWSNCLTATQFNLCAYLDKLPDNNVLYFMLFKIHWQWWPTRY